MCTQSLTPASSTLWLPIGMPARESLSTARETSGVISFGWLKWRFIHSGWYFAEHLAQLVVDALGQEHRHAGADPDDLDVRDLAEAAHDPLEQLRREGQPVPAGDQHVADLRRAAQVLELGLVVAAS